MVPFPKVIEKDQKILLTPTSFNDLSQLSQIDLLQSVIRSNHSLRMTAMGRSMMPFIKNGDRILITPVIAEELKVGNILAFEHPNNHKLTVHRLIQKRQGFLLMKGDNCQENDGVITYEKVIGKVIEIRRSKRNMKVGLTQFSKIVAWLSKHNKLKLVYSIDRFFQKLENSIFYL